MVSQPVDWTVDHGLQRERTLLAWQRTALSLGLVCAASIKVLTRHGGTPVLVLGSIGLILAVATYVAATRRYRRNRGHPISDGHLDPSGPPAFTLSLSVAALGMACVIYLVLTALAL